MIEITKENYDAIKTQMKAFLVSEITRYQEIAGGQMRLSQRLSSKSTKRVAMAMSRESFSGLEKIYKECLKKIK